MTDPIMQSTSEIEEANNTFTNIIKFLRDVVVIFLLAFFIRSFIMTPFQIQGASMNDSYTDKEYILVNSFSYLDFWTHFNEFIRTNSGTIAGSLAKTLAKIPLHFGDPDRGDVIVLRPHVDTSREYYIKRVIGLPGDSIRIGSGQVSIKKPGNNNFIQLNETYLSALNSGQTELEWSDIVREFIIPEGKYWVMGDNRMNSSDSRNCFKNCDNKNASHFLDRADIIGKVAMSFWYFNLFDSENSKIKQFSWGVKPRFFNTPSTAKYPELGE